jgi:hypothetical protein
VLAFFSFKSYRNNFRKIIFVVHVLIIRKAFLLLLYDMIGCLFSLLFLGEPVLYRNGINWKKGRKSSSHAQEDCVLLQPGTYPGDWDDVNCNASHAFICKYDIGEKLIKIILNYRNVTGIAKRFCKK